ncbi:hypothetical protein GYMLUDRAFT_242852 [Collybiopsis luxurians FD-317 M1]|uniref:Bacteriophage T5 Orf172 DNA-binding domain-containing protein n=1 Tax=Collybiopsis luxurians FD-317 M1 TaxID=944289 RepID=A0A0D0CZV0_9AGAR|nr:hypothetical protein GYMLUDRAFT_242852 [Collybiopsis luxurians FD-317 M1]
MRADTHGFRGVHEGHRLVLGPDGLPAQWDSSTPNDILLVRGPDDNVTERLLNLGVVTPCFGGFQIQIPDIQTLIGYREGMALGTSSTNYLPHSLEDFPGPAKDYPIGTHFDLRPYWAYTMARDLESWRRIPVCYRPLPRRHELVKHSDLILDCKLSKYPVISSKRYICYIYWYFEPPWTMKIGRTVNMKKRMWAWHLLCPNPLRVWLGAFVTAFGYGAETLTHWHIEKAAYDRPLKECLACRKMHREVFIDLQGLELMDKMILHTVRKVAQAFPSEL